MIIGDGYVEDHTQQSKSHSVFCVGDDTLQPKELDRLQKFLAQITCPSWHTAPPQNLGEASDGKLKADQWRSAIEFDVTAAIAHVWSNDSPQPEDEEKVQRWKMLVEATIHLATAIQWATSYHTSLVHAIHGYLSQHSQKIVSHDILVPQSSCCSAHWTSSSSIWSNAWLVDVRIQEGQRSSSKD